MKEEHSGIFVIGNLNMDLILEQRNPNQKARKKIGESYRLEPGGNAANAAVAAARAGGRVSLLGKIGRDAFGSQLLQGLLRENINLKWISEQEEAGTGLSLIIVADDTENSYVDVRGANALVSIRDVDAAKEDISRADILVIGLGVPLKSAIHAMRAAKEAGVPVLFEAYQSIAFRPDVFHLMDYLFLDSAEAAVLAGYEVVNWKSARIAAAQLFANGVQKCVVIHLKGHGLLLFSDEGFDMIEANPQMKIIDASAMDDCFVGVFAYCLRNHQGLNLQTAAAIAYEAALRAGSRFGAQASMPDAQEMKSIIHAYVME